MADESHEKEYSQGFSLKLALEEKSKQVLGDLKLAFSSDGLKKAYGGFQNNLFKNNQELLRIVQGFQKGLGQGIIDLRTTILSSFGSLIADAVSEMSNLLESSQLSNTQTRSTALQYGFTAAETYGFKQALDAVGLSGEEDLWYATNQELEQFSEAFNAYSEKYAQLYDQGFFEEMQRYQFEMNMFSQEMKLEIVQFFMNNKDLIQGGMRALIAILNWVTKIASFLVGTPHEVQVSETLGGYGYSKTTNNSIAIDNTFNGVQSTDQTALVNAGSQTYMQIIAALKGGQI